MRIKLLHDGVRYRGLIRQKGDTLEVSDDVGFRYCAAGWAIDESGKVQTSAPNMNTTLAVHSNRHEHTEGRNDG